MVQYRGRYIADDPTPISRGSSSFQYRGSFSKYPPCEIPNRNPNQKIPWGGVKNPAKNFYDSGPYEFLDVGMVPQWFPNGSQPYPTDCFRRRINSVYSGLQWWQSIWGLPHTILRTVPQRYPYNARQFLHCAYCLKPFLHGT